MNDKYERQMKKGVLDMLVLKLLESEPRYGYQIIQELKDKSGGCLFTKGWDIVSDFIPVGG